VPESSNLTNPVTFDKKLSEGKTASEPPKVLISYSHDSSEHAERALELANRLREDGVDCMIDQYVVVPEEGWPLWMEGQIRDSNFVLMICTETYYKRVVGQEQPGKGLGVRWEGNLIYSEIYRAGPRNTKFIPVFFENADPSHIPGPPRDTKYYSVGTEEGYEELYRRLTDQPRVIKPELGKLRSLPPAERKSEGVLGAILFKLPDGEEWRTAMTNIPVFTVKTAQGFHDQLLASAPEPATGKPDPAKMKTFLASYPETAKAMQLIGNHPVSSGSITAPTTA